MEGGREEGVRREGGGREEGERREGGGRRRRDGCEIRKESEDFFKAVIILDFISFDSF